jgi:hypothetical protein
MWKAFWSSWFRFAIVDESSSLAQSRAEQANGIDSTSRSADKPRRRNRAEVTQRYAGYVEALEQALATLERSSHILTASRLVMFLLAAVLGVLGWQAIEQSWWWVPSAVVSVVFMMLVQRHELLEREQRRARRMLHVYRQGLARCARDWRLLANRTVSLVGPEANLSTDLDLFGPASLFQLLHAGISPLGAERLRTWLLVPARPAEIVERQAAVRWLAERQALREQMLAECLRLEDRSNEQFVAWATGERWLARRTWLILVSRLMPLGVILLGWLGWTGTISSDLFGIGLLSIILINVLITIRFGSAVHDLFQRVGAEQGEVLSFVPLFQLIHTCDAHDPKLRSLREQLDATDVGPIAALRRLQGLIGWYKMNRSALLFLFFYLPLQALSLYDFHLLWILEQWQVRYGKHAPKWFDVLAEFEALVAVATLVFEEPQWCFPEVDVAADRIQASALGHPLLPESKRVSNDVEVGPAGTFLLVTGSNMSGKSTLLRSLGLNAALAQIGSVVCAKEFRMPPVTLATSIRVRDSLENGVSFYMAELLRLKWVVDQARTPVDKSPRRVLYLLDEILLGTNSRERHIAIVEVIAHLMQSRAIGAITTHDLEVATDERLQAACQRVHFQETLHPDDPDRPMTFDYRLRPGIATTTNALKLLEMVGLRPRPRR